MADTKDIKQIIIGSNTYTIKDASSVASLTWDATSGKLTVTLRNGSSSTIDTYKSDMTGIADHDLMQWNAANNTWVKIPRATSTAQVLTVNSMNNNVPTYTWRKPITVYNSLTELNNNLASLPVGTIVAVPD